MFSYKLYEVRLLCFQLLEGLDPSGTFLVAQTIVHHLIEECSKDRELEIFRRLVQPRSPTFAKSFPSAKIFCDASPEGCTRESP